MVFDTALQIPSTEAHNNVGHVERCSSSTELKLGWGKSWDVAKFIQKMIPLEKQPRSGLIPFGQCHGTA